MAGRTIEEARASFRANKPPNTRDPINNRAQRPTQSAHVAAANPSEPSPSPSVTSSSSTPVHTSPPGTVFVNGLPYVPDTTWHNANTSQSAHITEITSSPDVNDYRYHAFITLSPSSALPVSSSDNISSSSLPFIIDTGATCHISPFSSDFHSLRTIKPHPIKGLGNHSVDALGIGTIKLKTPSGRLTLTNAFYVPNATVRLISVYLLGESNYTSHFYPRQGHCFISDDNNNVVARGSALSNRKLFILSNFSLLTLPTDFAHYASRSPDIDAWHKRLGHCGTRTVIDMARSNVAQGMTINLSSPPPKCQHCILGKQTRSSVPR